MADQPVGTLPVPGVLTVVGQPWPRADAREKARGAALYLEDVRIAGMLYGRVYRSPYSHARIRRIDLSKAEALPGVIAVVTALVGFGRGLRRQ